MYKIFYTKKAISDIENLKAAKLDKKAKMLIEIIKQNPFESPPKFEKLKGDLNGAFSRRINIQHRLIYQILEEDKIIKILRLWTHYE